MIDYLFIGYYLFFKKRKDSTPIFSASNVLTLTVISWFFLLISILKKMAVITVTKFPGMNPGIVVIITLLLIILYRRFSKLKDTLAASIEGLSDKAQTNWIISAMVALVLPLIIIPFLLKK